MRIRSIKAQLASCPFPEPLERPFWSGVRVIYKRDMLLVTVETAEGVSGYGEGPASLQARRTIEGPIAEKLVGEEFSSVSDVESLWDEVVFPGPRQNRALTEPMGGVDVALYDILGKAEGKPIYDLLGGKLRNEVRTYASGGMYQPPEGYVQEALEAERNGFQAYKFRPALGPQEDVRLVEVLRDAVGYDFELLADVAVWHSRFGSLSYSFSVIRHIARRYEELNVYLLEEPFPAEDPHLYRDLRSCVELPIAGGESLTTLRDIQRWLWAEAVDILQSSPDHLGGITGSRRVLEVLKDTQVPLVPHNWATSLNALSIAQLLATYPEEIAPWMEFPIYSTSRWKGMYPFPLAEEILERPLTVENGYLVLPPGPGLGLEVDPEATRRYPYVVGRPN